MLAQLRRNDGVADNCGILSSLLYNLINLRLVLHIRHADYVEFFFYELARRSLDYGFSGFTNRIGNSINNGINLR